MSACIVPTAKANYAGILCWASFGSLLIDAAPEREILRADGAVSSGGDLGAVIDLTLQVLGLTLGEEGMHALHVVSGETVLGSRSFSVILQK